MKRAAALHYTEQARIAELEQANAELVAALQALLTNPHIDLGDLVYQIRDREALGWDGPSVKAWSDGIANARALIAKAGTQ